jgi:hypothetical protein
LARRDDRGFSGPHSRCNQGDLPERIEFCGICRSAQGRSPEPRNRHHLAEASNFEKSAGIQTTNKRHFVVLPRSTKYGISARKQPFRLVPADAGRKPKPARVSNAITSTSVTVRPAFRFQRNVPRGSCEFSSFLPVRLARFLVSTARRLCLAPFWQSLSPPPQNPPRYQPRQHTDTSKASTADIARYPTYWVWPTTSTSRSPLPVCRCYYRSVVPEPCLVPCNTANFWSFLLGRLPEKSLAILALSSGLSRTANCFHFVGGVLFRVTKVPRALSRDHHMEAARRHSTRGCARERLSQTNELLREGCNCGRSSFGEFCSVQGGAKHLASPLGHHPQARLALAISGLIIKLGYDRDPTILRLWSFSAQPAKYVSQFRGPNEEVDKKVRRTGLGMLWYSHSPNSFCFYGCGRHTKGICSQQQFVLASMSRDGSFYHAPELPRPAKHQSPRPALGELIQTRLFGHRKGHSHMSLLGCYRIDRPAQTGYTGWRLATARLLLRVSHPHLAGE